MKKIIYPIEELRKTCGYYDWDGEVERVFSPDVCLHPESKSPYYDEGHCMASNCPLGGLAEYQDFKECGYSDEEARDGDNQSDCVFMYEDDLTELQKRTE